MTNEEMWNESTPIAVLCSEQGWDLDIEIPDWIEGELSPCDVAAITQGGCDSGAYMPAVTYYQASQTMARYGDDVLQYLEDVYGEVPEVPKDSSWAGTACFYLSAAVELWAMTAEQALEAFDVPEDEDDEAPDSLYG